MWKSSVDPLDWDWLNLASLQPSSPNMLPAAVRLYLIVSHYWQLWHLLLLIQRKTALVSTHTADTRKEEYVRAVIFPFCFVLVRAYAVLQHTNPASTHQPHVWLRNLSHFFQKGVLHVLMGSLENSPNSWMFYHRVSATVCSVYGVCVEWPPRAPVWEPGAATAWCCTMHQTQRHTRNSKCSKVWFNLIIVDIGNRCHKCNTSCMCLAIIARLVWLSLPQPWVHLWEGGGTLR